MADRERRGTRSRNAVFVAKSQLLSASDVDRACRRMAHEIIERNAVLDDLVIVGLQTGGVVFAQRLADILRDVTGRLLPFGTLDVAFYRDDVALRPVLDAAATTLDVDLTDKVVLLVDDVLYTGRTIRAALNALSDWGRPRSVQLAVMVDRGHRELPIRADFIGKNLPTRHEEAIDANDEGVWIGSWVSR